MCVCVFVPVVETSLRIVSLYATCSGPRWVSMPYSLLIRSWMISMCSSPIPHRMVWGCGVIRQLVDSLWLRWSWLIPWWYYYLAGIRVNPDFKTGVFSLEAAECVLKIYQEEIQCVSDGKACRSVCSKRNIHVTDQPVWPWWAAQWCRRRRDQGPPPLRGPRWPAHHASSLPRRHFGLGGLRLLPTTSTKRWCPRWLSSMRA